MKNKITTTTALFVIMYVISNTVVANASEISRITSQPGITQAQWEATSQYQSFICPEGTGKGVGVDMNFTTDRSDDTWFATCNSREIVEPKPIIETSTITAPSILTTIDTATVVVSSTQSNTQKTETINTIVEPNKIINVTTNTTNSDTKTTIVETITKTDTNVVIVSSTETNNLSEIISNLKNQIIEIMKIIKKIGTFGKRSK